MTTDPTEGVIELLLSVRVIASGPAMAESDRVKNVQAETM